MAVKYLAGERLIGTAAERAALTTSTTSLDVDYVFNDNSVTPVWTLSGNATINNSSSGKLECGSNNNQVVDLAKTGTFTNLGSSNFILDWDVNFNSVETSANNAFGIIALSDFADMRQGTGDTGDAIVVTCTTLNQGGADDRELRFFYSDGTNAHSGETQSNYEMTDGTHYYIRSQRTTTTNVTHKGYTSASNRTSDSNALYTVNQTIPATVNSLDRITCFFGQSSGANGSVSAVRIDGIKLTATITGTIDYDIPNGAVFEESDTGKHYMFDGTSAWNEII